MIVSSMPLSILTAFAAAAKAKLPVVTVSSPYYYEHPDGIPDEYRVLSDDSGNFLLEISLDKKPEKDEEIEVFYRTVDDTAVSAWGDYESVGGTEEVSVKLNKSNGYKARVTIKASIIDEGIRIVDYETGEPNQKRIITRKFLFDLTRVEGNAVLYEPDPNDAKDIDRSQCYCYLKANSYHDARETGRPDYDAHFVHASQAISTPQIHYIGSHSDNIQIQFSKAWRDAVEAGYCDIGVAINGSSLESWYNSDGYANLELLYTYKGAERRAIRLCLEGEMDDSTYFGWQHAYAYFDGTKDKMNRLDEVYGLPEEIQADVNDFMKDNFVGIHGFANNEGTAYFVQMDAKRDPNAINELVKDLKALLNNGHAFYASTNGNYVVVPNYNLVFMKLPSNYVLADSYSYFFESQMDDSWEHRRLQNVHLAFHIIENGKPEVEVENGVQMVSTNLNEIKEGDPVQITVRFNRPVYVKDSITLNANINGTYPITLTAHGETVYSENGSKIVSCDPVSAKDNRYPIACDTLVFEGYLPEGAQNVPINSLEDIQFVDGKVYSFFSSLVFDSKSIDDIGGFTRDLRAPVASINTEPSKNWSNAEQVDICVKPVGSALESFNDYVTVYYQWSDSTELPKTYGSSITFHTASDGDALRTIIGTGNGEKYLHLKSLSIYGKETISDALSGTYDPSVEGAVYTPFGPYKFDNDAPTLDAKDIVATGTLKSRTITVPIPIEDESGLGIIALYYIPKDSKDGQGVLLKEFKPENFKGTPKKLQHTISHADVNVGVDEEGNVILERQELEFYWVITDQVGNSIGKTANFKLVFDSHDYLESEITSIEPYNPTTNKDDVKFNSTTNAVDELTYIYDYSKNKTKNPVVHQTLGKTLYYGFSFAVNHEAFGNSDDGIYSARVNYCDEPVGDFAVVEEKDGLFVVWLTEEIKSGRYDIQLTRTEGESTRVSRIYTIYATDGETDVTSVKDKVQTGTLLTNTVYQLSGEYPFFYYKDADGNRRQEYYGNTKQPATFSTLAKAKDYVYYKELGDIYLVQLTAATANALISGTTGYIVAKGESATPQAGQYWIRYKSDSWTPTSGDSSWVYYYYGVSGELSEDNLSLNLKSAINAVANRIVGYGSSVILTDTSIFLGSTMGEKMLDEYGMPYLLEGQIHNKDEMSTHTAAGNEWRVQIYYAADKNIYKSVVSVGDKSSDTYEEFSIAGNFKIDVDSRFQYKTYEDYNKNSAWKELNIAKGQAFIDVFTSSGVYYIRELADEGVAVYSIYVDKEAPKVTFTHKDDDGIFREIPVDGVEILEIRTRDLFIGSIAATEYDRLSYVSVYKVANLAHVATYTAPELDISPIKLEDGNYYIIVSDRSGNHYTVTAKVSSTDLECKISESTDKFIRLTCNRRGDQIVTYEVYLNGDLVTSTYVEEQTFDKSGLYTINIQDIYGNVFYEEYVFTRSYPKVTWKYLAEDGKYHTYDPNADTVNGFIMVETADNQYKISTSAKIRFSFSENYDYEFIGAAPEFNQSIGTETVVTIEAGQSFALKVYHKNYKDTYTMYTGVVDVTAPSISVMAEVDVLKNGEIDMFDEWIADGEIGDVINIKDISYFLSQIGRRTVLNGGTISSDIIKIDVVDANEVSFVEVYLDGELIMSQDKDTGFSQIVVSRWGAYRIVAKDILGNTSEFTFVNGLPDDIDYFVDGVSKQVDLHGYLNFKEVDGKYVYSKVDYGNDEFKITLKKNATVFMSVGVNGEEAKIYGYSIVDGKIHPVTYQIILDNENNTSVNMVVGEAIIDVNARDFNFKKEHKLNGDDEFAIYASVSADKVISIKAYAPEGESGMASISARVEFGESRTVCVSAEISKMVSDVFFDDLEGNDIASSQDGSYIRANEGFTVDETMFADQRIDSVSLYYSKLNDLDVNELEDRTNIYTSSESYTNEGFYLLVVKNLYGNQSVYRIAISRGFGITASVTFGDGQKIFYSKDYAKTLYSNNEITLDILNDEVSYVVTHNGERYNDFVRKEADGFTYFVFSDEGTYTVTLTDTYGNTVTKTMEISNSVYSVDDKLLTGYNENALRRDEGYTNQMLSIDKAIYESQDIYYLAVKFGDNVNVLVDSFSETPIVVDDEKLINVIGADGDGIYTLICRNRYGSVVTTAINYRSTPTLKLERTTRSQTESEIYDLNYALSLGFWSNNTMTFTTDAQTYVFKINGNVSDCPRTLTFETAGDYGSSEYDITYVDEYGFEYSFKAYLVRRDVTVEVPEGITGIEIDGVLNTRNNISILFDENVYATYTRNNGEETIYRSGDVLRKDGTYRFTVMDYAGNATMLTIKKDTIVEFSFMEANTDAVIQNGGVVNTSKIKLNKINKDSAYIERIIKDGVVQETFDGSIFAEDGKWEILMSDKLGNKAYFCFYVITHSQNGFAYTTPYEYRITEMWYDSGDGVKISYINFVDHNGTTSTFDVKDNGKYTVVMISDVTGMQSTFEFTVNTNAPEVTLVGCNEGETTINDVTIAGCKVGDRIKVYQITDTGEVLIEDVEVMSLSSKIPTITEGGKYRIIVESEAGVATELSFVRKHVMNTAGSVFIMVIIALCVIGLFTGLVYRNKSKTDE